jgi:flagellar biosynthesis protein FlhB
MVYEYLSSYFILEDSSSRFSKLFQTAITFSDIPRLVALMLQASKLLAMVENTKGLCPIVIGKAFFQLINRSIFLQFQVLFQKHVSPHQFRISTLKGCKTIFFGIKTFFNLHLN